MSYKITNTALDLNKRFLLRKAPKLQMEPVLAGRRLRLRSSMVISDELFEHNKANLELYKGWGVVEWEKVGEAKAEAEPPKPPIVTDPPADTVLEVPPAPPAETPPSEPKSEEPTKVESKTQPGKSAFKGKKQEGG